MAQVLGVPLLVALAGLMAFFVQRTVSRRRRWCTSAASRRRRASEIGRALFTTYLLPFEVTSVLILIAIVGAIVLARKEMD